MTLRSLADFTVAEEDVETSLGKWIPELSTEDADRFKVVKRLQKQHVEIMSQKCRRGRKGKRIDQGAAKQSKSRVKKKPAGPGGKQGKKVPKWMPEHDAKWRSIPFKKQKPHCAVGSVVSQQASKQSDKRAIHSCLRQCDPYIFCFTCARMLGSHAHMQITVSARLVWRKACDTIRLYHESIYATNSYYALLTPRMQNTLLMEQCRFEVGDPHRPISFDLQSSTGRVPRTALIHAVGCVLSRAGSSLGLLGHLHARHQPNTYIAFAHESAHACKHACYMHVCTYPCSRQGIENQDPSSCDGSRDGAPCQLPLGCVWYDTPTVTGEPGGRPQFGIEALLLQGASPEHLKAVCPGRYHAKFLPDLGGNAFLPTQFINFFIASLLTD